MSFETVRKNIFTQFDSIYDDSYPVEMPNRSLSVEQKDDIWMRVSIQGPIEERLELGRSAYEATGLISFQVFAPANSGTSKITKLIDTLSAIYRNKDFNGISCDGVEVEEVGLEGSTYQYNLTIPFEVDIFY